MNNKGKKFQMVTLDVTNLPAPEPMTKIIQALAKLTTAQFLQVNHRREPFPLFDKLTSAGWLYNCQQYAPANYKIYIYKAWHHQYVTQISSIKHNE